MPMPHSMRSLLSLTAAASGLFLLGTALVLTPASVHASSSSDAKAAGAALFHDKGCEYCHGADALGVADRGPNLSAVGKRLHKDAIEHQILAGGGGMPAYGDSLQPEEVKQLVEFLAAKKHQIPSKPGVPAAGA